MRRESKRPPRLFLREQHKPHRLFTNETRKAPHRPNRRPDTAEDQRQKDPELHVLFDATSHHSRSRPGLPPVPVPPRPAGALPSSLRAGGLFFPNPTRVDATPWIAHAKVISMMIGTSSRRVWPKARFFSQLVTQGTAPHGGGCQYLPIESTTGPTLPDGSPRNSTLLIALHSTHLLPTGSSVPPRGAFSLFKP